MGPPGGEIVISNQKANTNRIESPQLFFWLFPCLLLPPCGAIYAQTGVATLVRAHKQTTPYLVTTYFFCAMLSSVRQLASRTAAMQLRCFSVTPVTLAKQVKEAKQAKPKKEPSPEQVKIKQIREKLAKEKKKLALLKTKHKAKVAHHKELTAERKAEANQKKLEAKAFKPYRKITALNVFLKEKSGQGLNIAAVGQEWSRLSESEKDDLQAKADALNVENIKIWKPKPTPPANKYAAFVRERWVRDGRDFAEVSKELAAEWKLLPELEKEAYSATDAEKAAYEEELEAWKTERLELFKAKQASA